MFRADLRLTIPVHPLYRDIAVDLAVKFAEYGGVAESVAQQAGETVARWATHVAEGAPDNAEVLFEMEADDRAVTIRAASGRRRHEAAWPLTD